MSPNDEDPFDRLRPRLAAIAYRMLGTRADAEDVVQDAWLRWFRSERERVESPEAWLVTTVTRLAIDRLRSAKAEREAYVGWWLPEPLVAVEETTPQSTAELAQELSLALLWALPRRWMLAGLLAPVVLVGLAMAVSPQFNKRLSMAVAETSAYKTQNDATTSSGQRLNFWRRALQAIAEKPLYGHGVGSWNREYRRLENDNPSPVTAQVRNPHQEYLLWGVHLGVGGLLVFLVWAESTLRFSRSEIARSYRVFLEGVACSSHPEEG